MFGCVDKYDSLTIHIVMLVEMCEENLCSPVSTPCCLGGWDRIGRVHAYGRCRCGNDGSRSGAPTSFPFDPTVPGANLYTEGVWKATADCDIGHCRHRMPLQLALVSVDGLLKAGQNTLKTH